MLDEEHRRIFLRRWHWIGMTSDLQDHDDFLVDMVGAREVLVHNFEGRLRAFTNSCSHRGSALHAERRGNAPLQCPYHRWTYDERGIPTRIPLRDDFDCLAGRDPEALALERWRVETCGAMIFVCADASAASLRDDLGSAYAWLESIASGLGAELASFETEIAANWKVVMQNTVEFYHVYAVHPTTFAPMVRLPPVLTDMHAPEPHIRYVAAGRPKATPTSQPRLRGLFAPAPPMPHAGYEHLLMFPALTIGHTDGEAYAFFQYRPLEPGRTLLTARQWLPRFADERRQRDAIARHVGSDISAFTRTLADEDSRICELIQRGISSGPEQRRIPFADNEYLVERFQRCYLSIMGASCAIPRHLPGDRSEFGEPGAGTGSRPS